MFQQHYNPTGNFFLSVIVAAIPIMTLLYFIALHPHRDKQGNKHLGISAPYAAFYGVIAAFLVSCIPFGMPLPAAISAFALGSLSGFLGIIWIIIGAIFLYNMTLIAKKFEIVKESIIHISFDRRLQVLLIAFSFGAIIEGTSGYGTPVAIAGAVMVGLGFSPFQSAVLNLLANTAPVAWGAIGTPIVTLAAVSGLDQLKLSSMAGHQLPFCSVLVPFWLVTTFVLMEGGDLEGGLGGVAGDAVLGSVLRRHAVVRLVHDGLSPDDRRGLGRLFGHLHGALPALRLASQDALPPEV
jgi:lactate permease